MKKDRKNELGGARLKFVIVMAVMISGAYAGYLFLPVVYQAYLYKDLMQHYVDVAAAQGYQPSWAGEQLLKSEAEYDVPANALIEPAAQDNRIVVRIQFTKTIEFPGYTYEYQFDHTARSTAFLTFK